MVLNFAVALPGGYGLLGFLILSTLFGLCTSFIQCPSLPDSLDSSFGCVVTDKQCPNDNITFWLYTSDSQTEGRQLDLSKPETIQKEYFIDGPLIVLIHGYTGSKDFSPNKEIRPAYFHHGNYNVISVDYNPIALSPCYVSAVKNLPTVANCTAMLLDYMEDNKMTDMTDYHIIGFSLGGQTAGMINNFMSSGRMIPRITALDPAKPCFVDAPNSYRIDNEDAFFVDVIHTDVFARGILSPAGHADFYVNGGFNQPGCLQNITEFGSCNHARAPQYYAESVNSDQGFWGYQCPHWYAYMIGMCKSDQSSQAEMGKATPTNTRGIYFVSTNQIEPFAKGRLTSVENYFQEFLSFLFPFFIF